MGPDDLRVRRSLAVELAREAGRMAVTAFDALPEHRHKADGSEVTDADVAIEDMIRTRIGESFPDDGILGEERGVRAGSSGGRWVIDPIGGTSHFTRRLPVFTNDICFEDAHGPAVAVTSLPMAHRLLVAARGDGCRVVHGATSFDDAPLLHVSDTAELDGARVHALHLSAWPAAMVQVTHERLRLLDPLDAIGRFLAADSDAIVLAGPGLAYEDVAALPVLVEEAGGRVSDLGGGDVLTGDGSVLVTNQVLHEPLRRLLAGRCSDSSAQR